MSGGRLNKFWIHPDRAEEREEVCDTVRQKRYEMMS